MNLNREGEKKCGGASATLSNRIEKIVETEHAPSVPNACDLILQFFVQSLREKSSKSIKIRQNKIFD